MWTEDINQRGSYAPIGSNATRPESLANKGEMVAECPRKP